MSPVLYDAAMTVLPKNYEVHVKGAVAHYWETLGVQGKKQAAGSADRGSRSAVTGGKQMDGFCQLVRWVVIENGMPAASVHTTNSLELPGYFRPTKKWDLVVVHEHRLVAAIEFKSQAGPSFGNNFNNRTEESIGNAVDIAVACREGAYGSTAPRPWVGWIMVVEECPGSTKAVRVDEPHFNVFEDFRGASYAARYELLMRRLLLEKHYDGASLLLSPRGSEGIYQEPAADLSMKRFLASLGGHVQSFLASF
jgi:hypothetical protein